MVKQTGDKPKRVCTLPPGPGRPKGIPNKNTTALKDMILQALTGVGGIDYLMAQAAENPTAFLTLVGKVIPVDTNMVHSGNIGIIKFPGLDG